MIRSLLSDLTQLRGANPQESHIIEMQLLHTEPTLHLTKTRASTATWTGREATRLLTAPRPGVPSLPRPLALSPGSRGVGADGRQQSRKRERGACDYNSGKRVFSS